MTLQQIYYAILVADIGSMNKAAENLFISQPTLTTAIKELENEIGIIIFNRTNRGVMVRKETLKRSFRFLVSTILLRPKLL